MTTPDVQLLTAFWPAHAELFALALCDVAWDQRMRARRTASFGRPYNYSGMTYPEAAFPAWLEPVRRAVTPRVGFDPDSCLLNHYASGTRTMGFHVDALEDLWPGTGVAILSLGAARSMRFRRLERREVTWDLRLEPGSLLYMPPAVQLTWQHALPVESGAGERISLTFRRLRSP
jgi:alkylated DNA repair dioxygenase AlkB